jgi:hypothetical protein
MQVQKSWRIWIPGEDRLSRRSTPPNYLQLPAGLRRSEHLTATFSACVQKHFRIGIELRVSDLPGTSRITALPENGENPISSKGLHFHLCSRCENFPLGSLRGTVKTAAREQWANVGVAAGEVAEEIQCLAAAPA